MKTVPLTNKEFVQDTRQLATQITNYLNKYQEPTSYIRPITKHQKQQTERAMMLLEIAFRSFHIYR